MNIEAQNRQKLRTKVKFKNIGENLRTQETRPKFPGSYKKSVPQVHKLHSISMNLASIQPLLSLIYPFHNCEVQHLTAHLKAPSSLSFG